MPRYRSGSRHATNDKNMKTTEDQKSKTYRPRSVSSLLMRFNAISTDYVLCEGLVKGGFCDDGEGLAIVVKRQKSKINREEGDP